MSQPIPHNGVGVLGLGSGRVPVAERPMPRFPTKVEPPKKPHPYKPRDPNRTMTPEGAQLEREREREDYYRRKFGLPPYD